MIKSFILNYRFVFCNIFSLLLLINLPTKAQTFEVSIAQQINGSIDRVAENIYEIPIRLRIANDGNTDATDLKINSDIADDFGLDPIAVSVVSPPEIVWITSGSNVQLNPTYAAKHLYAGILDTVGNHFAAGGKLTIQYRVRVNFGECYGKFYTQSKLSATSEEGLVEFDLSDDGKEWDEDKTDNLIGNGLTEDDPSLIFIEQATHIAVALDINGTVEQQGNSTTYLVPMRIRLQNMGQSEIVQLSLLDDLQRHFKVRAEDIQIISGYPQLVWSSSGSSLTINTNFTGSSPNHNLLTTAPVSLASMAKATIQLNALIDFGTTKGIFYNQIEAYSVDESGRVDRDLSDAGKVWDEDINDAKPGSGNNENDITIINLNRNTHVGLAQQINGTITQVNGTQYRFPIRFRLKNMGSTDLVKLSIINNLSQNLDVPPTAINLNSFPELIWLTTGSTLNLNTAYDGGTNSMLLQENGNLLKAGHNATIQLDVTVDFGINYGEYENAAIVIAEDANGNVIADFSDEGKLWDENPNDNNLGDGVAENDPTIIKLGDAPSSKPNILFIVIDDINNYTGTFGGHPNAYTPNIDNLASESMIFTNAQTNAVFCNPSRISMLTGLKPSSSGIVDNGDYYYDWRAVMNADTSIATQNYGPNSGNIQTIYEALENEYYMAYSGKIYHGAGQLDPIAWDDYRPWINYLTISGIQNHPVNGLVDYTKDSNRNLDWGAVEDAEKATAPGTYFTEEDTEDYIITQNALEIINNLPTTDPFFLSVGFIRPHLPLYVPQRVIDLFKDSLDTFDHIALPQYLENDQDDTVYKTNSVHKTNVFDYPERWKSLIAHALASGTWIDEYIGSIIQTLKARNLYDNTIIILTSDHGYAFGEKQHMKKGALWREACDIPLIIKAPTITTAGSSTDEVVSLIDLFPTIMELSDQKMPDDLPRDGRSLVPLLKNPSRPWPWLASIDFYDKKHDYLAKGLRSKNKTFKYHYIYKEEKPCFNAELYDLENDPFEWYNLLSGVHRNPELHATEKKELEKIIAGQLIPNKAPSTFNKLIKVNNLTQQHTIKLVGEDSNKDFLLFEIESLPLYGKLYESIDGTIIGNEILNTHSIIPNEEGSIAYLIYEPDPSFSTELTDVFTFTVTDGSTKDRGITLIQYE